MEGLRRYLDQLYHGATPQAIMQTALPGLVNNIKQMDSISRFYSRSGFLGLFFTKVSGDTLIDLLHITNKTTRFGIQCKYWL